MLFQLLFGVSRVVAYTVHESPTPPTDRIDRAEALRFVKDGFALPAALSAPVWLAAHQLWLAFAGYLAVAALIAGAYVWFGLPDIAAVIALVALHLIVGFEADSIERSDLERKGWSSLGAVTGANANECQRRFFDQWLPMQPVLAGRAAASPPVPQKTAATVSPPAGLRGGNTAADRLAALWRKS